MSGGHLSTLNDWSRTNIHFTIHTYMSADSAAIVASLSGLAVFILGIFAFVFWAISKQPSAEEKRVWLSAIATTKTATTEMDDRSSGTCNTLSSACETLWTRGRPIELSTISGERNENATRRNKGEKFKDQLLGLLDRNHKRTGERVIQGQPIKLEITSVGFFWWIISD